VKSAQSQVPIGLWALALGVTGFAAGFFGPIVLNPGANQGPLVGLFITGPGGALGGVILGTIFHLLPVSNSTRGKALVWTCFALAVGTLFFCLPPPTVLGYVIDAEVSECAVPRDWARAALATWEQAVQRTTWYTPPADWKETALRNVNEADGVVLTMRVARRAALYQHHKPWNSGRKTAGPWQPVESPERYYASQNGAACEPYLNRTRELYMPFTDSPSNPNEPARVWPPTDVVSFLRLMQLGPVPAEYRRLLQLE
jgi:hypothetical protein